MFRKPSSIGNRFVVGGATLACALFSGIAVAKDHYVTEAIHVDTRGLDLSRAADARTLYTRIEYAAWFVCTHGVRVDLAPVDDVKGCSEKALGDTIRSANIPLLTKIYQASHTQLASK